MEHSVPFKCSVGKGQRIVNYINRCLQNENAYFLTIMVTFNSNKAPTVHLMC